MRGFSLSKQRRLIGFSRTAMLYWTRRGRSRSSPGRQAGRLSLTRWPRRCPPWWRISSIRRGRQLRRLSCRICSMLAGRSVPHPIFSASVETFGPASCTKPSSPSSLCLTRRTCSRTTLRWSGCRTLRCSRRLLRDTVGRGTRRGSQLI